MLYVVLSRYIVLYIMICLIEFYCYTVSYKAIYTLFNMILKYNFEYSCERGILTLQYLCLSNISTFILE